MIEYRNLSIEAQNQLIEQYGDEKLGVIWIGAGVYSLTHPLLSHNPDNNWHIWTDSSPRVVHSALKAFSQMQDKGRAANLSHTVNLPEDGNRLNEWITFLSDHVDRIIIMGYGVTYALTPAENLTWMKQIDRSKMNLPLHIVFNSPGAKIDFLPGLMAAYHNQRMVYYSNEHVEDLFQKAFTNSQVSWHKARENTKTNIWGTWIVDVLPETQSA
ncbi:MAG: hypothetical protein AB8H47_19960 [Bacteroidia bacterium]